MNQGEMTTSPFIFLVMKHESGEVTTSPFIFLFGNFLHGDSVDSEEAGGRDLAAR
jgi:hypothetical protein